MHTIVYPYFAVVENGILFDSYDDMGHRRKRDIHELLQKNKYQEENVCWAKDIFVVGVLKVVSPDLECIDVRWRVIIPVHGRYFFTITTVQRYRKRMRCMSLLNCMGVLEYFERVHGEYSWIAWDLSRDHQYIKNSLVECHLI